jgi:acetyltransferase-like isoleucine patch superfamily enzyme
MIDPRAYVDDWARVDHTVTIGAGSKIWQFASVVRGAVLGANCSVAPGACIDGSHFGDDCKIGHNVAMGPGFRIGNGCFVGPGVVLGNDFWPRAHERGFDYTALFHGDIVCVVLEDGASLGMKSCVLPGITIGENAMVAAGAVVKRDVPANHLYTATDRIRPFTREPARMRDVDDKIVREWTEFGKKHLMAAE